MSENLRTPTWLGSISQSPLGSHTIIPSCIGVLDKLSDIFEELTKRHVTGSVDSVVEESSPPKEGVFSEQDTVNTCQTLLCGIVWL